MNSSNKDSILVVDDMRANLRFLVEILTQQGYTVRPALDGETALASVSARPPDLILLDIMMPRLDGYEVCTRLKANPATCDIPIVFLSALNEVGDKVKAFAMGGVDYITKPFQMEEVLARVATHLTLRKLHKQLATQNEVLKCEVAERERTQDALEQYTRELEISNAELDAFAHTVAHDLKTPLTAMLGFSSVLERRITQLSPEQIRERIGLIKQTGHKMTDIINELLLLASVRKMEEVTLSTVNMERITAEAQSRLSTMISERQATIVAPERWPRAWGYAPWLEEVWVNYMSNALKYGGKPEAGVAPHIELGWRKTDTNGAKQETEMEKALNNHCPAASFQHCASQNTTPQLCFWVRDNGPGISTTAQAQLFTEFTRLEQSRAQGHGLGLSIVRRIVEKLGGQVGVESQIGAGSTFWFSLPPRAE